MPVGSNSRSVKKLEITKLISDLLIMICCSTGGVHTVHNAHALTLLVFREAHDVSTVHYCVFVLGRDIHKLFTYRDLFIRHRNDFVLVSYEFSH